MLKTGEEHAKKHQFYDYKLHQMLIFCLKDVEVIGERDPSGTSLI